MILMAVALIAIVAVSGCTSSPAVTPTPTAVPATATPAPTAQAVLTVSGSVDNPLALSMADLNAYENKSISTPFKNNTTLNATGVSLNKLLDDSKVKSTATNVTLTASDGYNKTVMLSDIRASTDAIVAYDNGTLRAIIPGQATGSWVSKLSKIVVS
jgi:DMSO/TMAO reductase YedYZ molybdopterin-dependent catalytic subunit